MLFQVDVPYELLVLFPLSSLNKQHKKEQNATFLHDTLAQIHTQVQHSLANTQQKYKLYQD